MSHLQSAELGLVIWITGAPSSGKSTLAERLHEDLVRRQLRCCALDGDDVRDALVPRPGYSEAERAAFYETLARLAALMAGQGLVVIVSATAHERRYRATARALAPRFLEVFVDVDAAERERRDAKGLYARAREGGLAGLPGADLEYERPEAPDIVANGGLDQGAVQAIAEQVGPAGGWPRSCLEATR
jgi:adenylylsulfate kinase